MEFRWWLARMKLLWRLLKLAPYAREIELEYQGMKQKMFDAAFPAPESGLSSKREEYCYWLGYNEGVQFLLNHPILKK